jgi:two-component system, NarL family, invasion response regulator UvrY
LNILIADDHAALRKGVIQILREELPDARFGEASTTSETLDCLYRQEWDVLILDIFMPGRGGLETLDFLRREYPNMPVLVLSSAPEEQMALRILKLGANGYLNKQAAPEELVTAVKKVFSGGEYVSPRTAERLAVDIGRKERAPIEKLSDREFTVLQLLAAGKSIKEIASELSLNAKTVSTYHARIRHKLNVNNDVEMIRYLLDQGFTEKG